MPAKTSAPKTQKPQRQAPEKPTVEDEFASLLEASSPKEPEPQKDFTKLSSLSQYLDTNI
jgi:hypothetical protein